MQIDVRTENRTGIAQEVLGILMDEKIDLRAVEVVEHHLYIQIPNLDEESLGTLAEALTAVSGVHAVSRLDVMPRDRRRNQISALLAAIPDPVIAIDQDAGILMINEAARSILGLDAGAEASILGRPLEDVTRNEELSGVLMASGFDLSNQEVTLGQEPFYLECRPVSAKEDEAIGTIGGVLIFHSPSRIGARLSVVQGQKAAGFEAIIAIAEPSKDLIERARRAALVNAPLMIWGKPALARSFWQGLAIRHQIEGRHPFLH